MCVCVGERERQIERETELERERVRESTRRDAIPVNILIRSSVNHRPFLQLITSGPWTSECLLHRYLSQN